MCNKNLLVYTKVYVLKIELLIIDFESHSIDYVLNKHFKFVFVFLYLILMHLSAEKSQSQFTARAVVVFTKKH